MHLLIPCAGALSEAGRAATATLALPTLARLLARLQRTRRDAGDEYTRNPPHERALAAALGWHGDDGTLPWAAWHAAADGLDPGDQAWGLLTPAHQHVGTEQVTLLDPIELRLDEAASRALLDAVRELLESEGFTVAWGAPLRWYVAHPMLDGLATTSPDRVIGRNVDAWLPDQPQARLLRRLQMEVQMALHALPLNEAREDAGALAVNATWLSGCGRAQPVRAGNPPVVDERLRTPALREDWHAWQAAWLDLDRGPIADLLRRVERGEPATLTLCGERHADQYAAVPAGWWQRLLGRRPSDAAVRATLNDL